MAAAPDRSADRARLDERPHATPAEARALASPLRLRILRLTLDEPLTNRQLAERLGKDPATVLHHVRTLVDTGFLAALEARRGARGAREIPYRATRKSWTLNFDDQPSRRLNHAALSAFLEELAEAGGEMSNEFRMALWLTPGDFDEFGQRLYDVIEDFRTRYQAGAVPEGAERWSLFTAMHRQP